MNISTRAFKSLLAIVLALSLAAGASAASFTAPQKLADYLYYMEFTDYTPDLTTGENVKMGSHAQQCATGISMAAI